MANHHYAVLLLSQDLIERSNFLFSRIVRYHTATKYIFYTLSAALVLFCLGLFVEILSSTVFYSTFVALAGFLAMILINRRMYRLYVQLAGIYPLVTNIANFAYDHQTQAQLVTPEIWEEIWEKYGKKLQCATDNENIKKELEKRAGI